MKKTWQGINNIIGRKSTNANPINLIETSNVGNTVISDLIAISNIFNRHFASVGPKLATKLNYVINPFPSFFLVRQVSIKKREVILLFACAH